MTIALSAPQKFFVDSWNVYRKIVEHDYMFHREIYSDVYGVLREGFDQPFSMLDLGCGDASSITQVMKRLAIESYRGVDLSGPALELASRNLGELSCPTDLINADLLEYLEASPGEYDVIFSGFALHHLPSDRKQDFFRHCADRLSANGILLLIDVVRGEDQDLPAYLETYCDMMAKEWTELDAGELEFVISHVEGNDRPERLSDLQVMGEQAGLAAFRHVSRYTWHQVCLFRKGNSRR